MNSRSSSPRGCLGTGYNEIRGFRLVMWLLSVSTTTMRGTVQQIIGLEAGQHNVTVLPGQQKLRKVVPAALRPRKSVPAHRSHHRRCDWCN